MQQSHARLYRRQYLVGPEAVAVREDWRSRQLGWQLWISHCPTLSVAWQQDAEGQLWAVLGVAAQSLAEAPDPVDQIAGSSTAAVPELSRTWAGRWLLIGDDRLYLDAAGTLGCFYRTVGDRVWLSSSAGLLTEVPEPLAARPDPRSLQGALSWYPQPRSRWPGVAALMSSQVLSLRDGSIEPRPLLAPIDPSRDVEETLTAWMTGLATAMRRLPRDRPLWLAATAGRDSRLLVALARSVDLPVTLYTQDHRNIRLADRLMTPRIAAVAGYEHVLVRRRRSTVLSHELVERHTGGQAPPVPEQLLLEGLWDFGRGLALRGNGCGIGKGSFPRMYLPEGLDTVDQRVAALLAAYSEPPTSTAATGLREWAHWVEQTSQDHFDWRDRFRIEQRLGGWLSALDQQTDLSDMSCAQVANAASSYALVLSLPLELRLPGRHHLEIVGRLAPALLEFPLTPPDRHFGVTRALVSGLRTNPRRLVRKAVRRIVRAAASPVPRTQPPKGSAR